MFISLNMICLSDFASESLPLMNSCTVRGSALPVWRMSEKFLLSCNRRRCIIQQPRAGIQAVVNILKKREKSNEMCQ